MNNEQFKKARPTEQSFGRGIEDLKSIRLADAEKSRMLKSVFATPIRSPYMQRIPVFAFVYSFILLITISGMTYASASSLPGDVLYPIKTGVVESVLDVLNHSPEKKIVWEEEKVERRIVEAEVLAKQGRLDDKKLEGLERSIEKSSNAFAKAADAVASSTNLKKNFRRRINERQGVFDREEKKEEIKIEIVSTTTEDSSNIDLSGKKDKINRLKDTVIKVLEN